MITVHDVRFTMSGFPRSSTWNIRRHQFLWPESAASALYNALDEDFLDGFAQYSAEFIAVYRYVLLNGQWKLIATQMNFGPYPNAVLDPSGKPWRTS